MTGRKDPTTTYDRMMAEIQMDSDDEADDHAPQPRRETLKPQQRAESKRTSANASIAKSSQFDEKQRSRDASGDWPQAEQKHSQLTVDAKEGPDSDERTASSRRRRSSFPPVRRSSGRRSSKSHNSDHEDLSDSEHECVAPVRQREVDKFGEGSPTSAMTTATSASRVEMNALRSFLTKAPKQGALPIKCYVERDRHGLKMLHPVYRLYLEDGKHFLLSAQKRSGSKTSNYLLSMEPNSTDRRSAHVLGKLRANWSGSEYTIFDGGLSPSKTALDANVRDIVGFIEFAYDEMGPGRMNVRIPTVQDSGMAIQWKDSDLGKDVASRKAIEDSLNKSSLMLRNKRPQFDAKSGGHVLDFQGRVTMPSIKNFQLQSDEHGDTTVLQFGRVSCQPPGPNAQCKCHKHTFVMDVRHPLSPVQAFAICLATLDTKVADAKVYESMTKLVTKKTK